jgi:metal-sulfur cluster biosynthetic enzyme
MEALGQVIVPDIAVTLLNLSASQSIPFAEALLCIKNLGYIDLMAQYCYHTEATIEYMEDDLEDVPCHNNVSS